jgi:predicted nucleic acid-binding Zn ribbon protein
MTWAGEIWLIRVIADERVIFDERDHLISYNEHRKRRLVLLTIALVAIGAVLVWRTKNE